MIRQAVNRPATLSRRILQVLLDRGMTQSELASKLRVNRSHISRVKSGEHEWSDLQLEQIERVTKMPLGLLLLGAEPSARADKELRRMYKDVKHLLAESSTARQGMQAIISSIENR